MEAMIEDPIDAPQRPGNPNDLAGSGGYTPLAGPGAGTGVQFHAFNSQSGGTGQFPLFLVNILFGGGAASHHPGIVVLGQHIRLNPDPLWLALFSLPFVGPAYNAYPSAVGPFWNPNAGWQPGGESTSPTLPLTPGTLGLTMGCAFITANLASPPPLVTNSSNGSQFTVK
jgi:hypothetical protein